MGRLLASKIAPRHRRVEAGTIYALLFPEFINRKERKERKDRNIPADFFAFFADKSPLSSLRDSASPREPVWTQLNRTVTTSVPLVVALTIAMRR